MNFEAAVEAVISGNTLTLESMLRENPELIRARSALQMPAKTTEE